MWSPRLANAHFWLATAGILLYIVPIYVAGLTQGLMWQAMTPEGQLAYPDFVETVRAIIPHWWLRVLGGSLYLSGAVLGGVNLYQTWRQRPAEYEEPTVVAAPLAAHYDGDPVRPASQWEGMHSVAEAAKRWDVFATMWWHRKWERLPVKFTVLTCVAVLAASAFELIPSFVIRSNVPTIEGVKPYSPLELAGRDLYVAEGCYNCHSQQIRPLLAETKRYGDYSRAGEHVYDHPFQWGSRRIGPDLAREGGKQSHLWHVLHFEAARQVTPGSVMPNYPHLLRDKLDFDSIPLRVKANRAVGVPYDDLAVMASKDDARAQAKKIADEIVQQGGPAGLEDKEVVALIAYLQRLGVDYTNPAPPAEAAEATPASAATEKTEVPQ